MNTQRRKSGIEWKQGEEVEPGQAETVSFSWILYILFFFGFLPMWEEMGPLFVFTTLVLTILGFFFFLPYLTKSKRSIEMQTVQSAQMRQANFILNALKSG